MTVPSVTYVVSDVHLGPPGPLTSFRQARRLCRFINWIRTEHTSSELVLAGDVFDFLLRYGSFDFGSTTAGEQLQRIVDNNADVFDSLFEYCRSNQLVILSGNHDPELLRHDIRVQLARRLGTPVRDIVWADDLPPLSHGQEGSHLPLSGYRAHHSHDGREVWILHGDVWDADNAINRASIRQSLIDGSDITPVPGTLLVMDILNYLKADSPWIDTLKPEMETVFPLLVVLRTKDLLRRVLSSTTPALLLGAIQSRIATTSLGSTAVRGTHQTTVADIFSSVVAAAIRSQPKQAQESLQMDLSDLLNRSTESNSRSLGGYDPLKHLLVQLALSNDRVFQPPEPQKIADEFPFNPQQVATIVSGHTHFAGVSQSHGIRHINTGTWLPISHIPRDLEPQNIIEVLKANSLPTRNPCTVVRITSVESELLDVSDDGVPTSVDRDA